MPVSSYTLTITMDTPQKSLVHAHSITAERAQLEFPPRSAISTVTTIISSCVDLEKTVPLGAEKMHLCLKLIKFSTNPFGLAAIDVIIAKLQT